MRTRALPMLLLCSMLASVAQAQILPKDEMKFCEALPSLQEALNNSEGSTSENPLRQEQLRHDASSAAVRSFLVRSGWKSRSESAKGWIGELNSVAESHEWGDFVGVTVKLPCADIVIGVPQEAVEEWSSDRVDPVAAKCQPADPYINRDMPLFAMLSKLDLSQRVIFSGRFCAIPESVEGGVVYFAFSKISAAP